MATNEDNTPSRINWLLIGMALGIVMGPFVVMIVGPDPGINHPRLRSAK